MQVIELNNMELGILATGAIVAGIWLLILGGDWLIEASVAIAEKAQLSKIFIGATIIAFGTSVPELFTSVNANVSGFPGISLGNIIGSNIANVLLVIGASALFATLTVPYREVRNDLFLMAVATLILVAGIYYGVFEQWVGFLMFALLVLFIGYQYFSRQIDTSEVEDIDMSNAKAALYVIGGFVALALGSELLVRGAVVTGRVVGVPEAIVGMTAVAIGTSLPELTASIAAVMKRETDLIFGNIIGSNVFNILWIVGITAMIKPLPVDPGIGIGDVAVMVGVSSMFTIMIMMGTQITKLIGALFLVAYAVFTLSQFWSVL